MYQSAKIDNIFKKNNSVQVKTVKKLLSWYYKRGETVNTNKKKKTLNINMPIGYSKSIHAWILLLSLFGSFMVASASMKTFTTNNGLMFLIAKQMVFIIASYAGMVFFAKLFKWNWIRDKKKELISIAFMIIFLLIPRLNTSQFIRTGAYNWIDFKYFTIQPSEFSKPFIMLLVANALGGLSIYPWMKDRTIMKKVSFLDRLKQLCKNIRTPLIAVIIMIAIIAFVQKDFGTAMIIVLISASIFFLAQHPFLTQIQRVLFVLFITILGIGIFMMSPAGLEFLPKLGFKEFQINRIRSLYNLFDKTTMYNESMQQVRGLYAFARGGLFGVGFGKSIQKYDYLPAAQTDYILAILVEELGFVAFLIVTLGYVWIIFTLFKYAFKINYQPSKLYLMGVATYFFIHYLFNVGGTSAILPLTGVPLLLISSGGSSQLAVFISIGIAQNLIARYEQGRKKKAALQKL